MPLMIQRIARGLLPMLDATRPLAHQSQPVRIVMAPRPGHRPSDRPPVRIFLGSERGQFRAERVFLWSIEKHRDPARAYEIYLMKHLTGFRDRFWLTAFTNYRFAVPGFCEYQGRAIYNDVDQIYLADPAELFDLDMHDAGFLSINDRDTSVMLIDCARMASAWPADAARTERRQVLEARARQQSLWGRLDGHWNARDKEFDAARSKLVHFTTLHTQPWRPFPEHFVYFENPTGSLWSDLEAEADQAGFLPVTADRPSAGWARATERLSRSEDGRRLLDALSHAPADSGPRAAGPLHLRGVLEHVPDDDLPWVLDELFANRSELVLDVHEPLANDADRQRRCLWFWQQQLQRASARHPTTRWQLNRRCGLAHVHLEGGAARPGPLTVLLHRKPGHDHQALALARTVAALSDRELHEQRIPWSAAGYLVRRLVGGGRLDGIPEDSAAIIAAGWLPTRVARRSRGRTRLVLLGRKAGTTPLQGGVVVQCRHFGLPCHPNRITTLLPLNAGVGAPNQRSDRWQRWMSAPHRAAVLVGGASRSHRFGAEDARLLGRAASDWAREQQAALLVVTARRTAAAANELARTLRESDDLYVWQPDDPDNPYTLALHHADALLVTGESESMLADAVASGLPVQIWPLPEQRGTPWQAFCRWVAERAGRPRYNRRGSIRPQQGLGYLCARALERGWALPPRDLPALHDALYYRGLAVRFGEPLPAQHEPFHELDGVARLLTRRLGLAPDATHSTGNGALNVIDHAS